MLYLVNKVLLPEQIVLGGNKTSLIHFAFLHDFTAFADISVFVKYLFFRADVFSVFIIKDNAENATLARTMGFESNKEYNEIMFLREITHTVNMFNDMGDIVRLYSKNPETATVRLANLLSMVSGEESESV